MTVSKRAIVTGTYITPVTDPPDGMSVARCRELETAVARGLTDAELADKHGATANELAAMRRRMEQLE